MKSSRLKWWHRGGVVHPVDGVDTIPALLSESQHWHDRHADINNDPPCDDPSCFFLAVYR